MSLRTFAFFLALLEVVAVVASVKLLGFGFVVLLMILSGMIGSLLLRWQGLATAEAFVSQLEHGRPPMEAAWDGFCILLAGGLFIIPGLVTDFVALLLLIPPLRRALYRFVNKSGMTAGHYWFTASQSTLSSSQGQVIDAQYEDVTPRSGS